MSVRNRKITVNERIDRILDGSCREAILLPEDDEKAMQRTLDSKRISDLYNVSFEDRYLKSRLASLPSPLTKERQESRSRLRFSRDGYNCYCSTASCPSLISTPSTVEPLSPVKATKAQHPWYLGQNNTIETPSCNLPAKMKRYGARGTIQLLSHDTIAGTVPTLTSIKYNKPSPLKELGKVQKLNAWSPKLHGTPTLWPEEAAFVNGPKITFRNTHHATKSGVSPKKSILTEPVLADEHFKQQQAAKANLQASRDKLEKMLRKKQQYLQSHPNIHHDKVPAKALKEITLIQSFESPHVSSIETKLVQCKYELRWKTIFLLIDSIRRSAFNRPILQELTLVLEKVSDWGIRHNLCNPFEMTRDQCRDLFMREYPGFGVANFNLMYSSFDPTHLDIVDVRDIIATVKALRLSNGSAAVGTTIKDVVYDLIAMYANESTVQTKCIEKVLELYCGSLEDEAKIHNKLMALYDSQYRSFRNPKAQVHLEDVHAFLSNQPEFVALFSDMLRQRRRHMNSYTIHENKD
ncbi:hypothetical protein THRCLA_05336 [Thraustotheca clavata]|uniref:Uncharacterized protein n=1 Tax=Thraustotheca clavata TaxID=74557 RepID=A0A1V9ZW94_9STRA|nr:hypothetical protein THRCLA_05336 [Thraustotheca clavata]